MNRHFTPLPSYRTAAIILLMILLLSLFSTAASAQDRDTSRVELWRPGDPGIRLLLDARAVSDIGEPLPGASLVMRQADGSGQYHADAYRAALTANAQGQFRIGTVVPDSYGYGKHIHVQVSLPGYRSLFGEVVFRDEAGQADSEDPLAISLEELKTDEGVVMVGGVEFVLQPE